MAELKKSLGFWSIIALTITAMVGTGMFFGTSVGAGYAGNAVILSWIILIVLALYVAACFGELIALFPSAGGVYEFAKHSYGRFISFLVGWLTWLMSNVATTVLIIAALQYLLPADSTIELRLGVAVGFIILMNFVAYLGVDISGAVLMVFAVEIIFMFLAIILPGLTSINTANFSPFITKPMPMIVVSLFFMLESLMGWESASFLAEETKEPGKVIPKALMITTFIAGLLGLGVAVVSLGVIPWHVLAQSPAPINDVTVSLLGPTGSRIISLAIVFALIGSVAGSIISTPRLLLAMARDKVFISQLAAIHPKRRTPHNAIIFQTIISIILIFIGFGEYTRLLALFTPLALIVYIFILLALPILRFRMPDARRDFRVPFGIIGPVLVSLAYAVVIAVWFQTVPGAPGIFWLMMSLFFFGLPIYLLMIFFYNPDAVISFMNGFARFNLWFENFILPKRIRKAVIALTRDLRQKSILEYGAGVGTMTLHLAEAVGPYGRIYATDLSHKNIHLLKKRLEKKGIKHVTVIHDEHQVNRVHPAVKEVDVVFSIGAMSYMQDVKKILKEMHRLLPESGEICFLEYVNFFRLLPDKEWISDKAQLKKLFRDAGFSVRIELKRGFLWDYLIVYGIKSEKDIPIV